MPQMSREDFNQRILIHSKVLDHQLEKSKIYTQKEMSEREIVIKSCLGQLEQYGIEKWKKDFVRIVATHDSSYEENCKVDLDMAQNERNKYWCKLLSNMPAELKRFQEIFVEPQEFIIRRNNSQFFQKEDILACYVSPSLIPDKLMQDLKLCDFSDCKNNPLMRLERKADPKTIEALKLIFINLSQIDSKNHRLYKLEKINSNDPELQSILAQYNKECVGKFLVIASLGGTNLLFNIDSIAKSGVPFVKRKVLFFQDLEAISRASSHIEKTYESELEKLAKISQKINLVRIKLFSWRKDTPKSIKGMIIKETLEMCDEITSELAEVINSNKIKATKLLTELSEAQRKRNNPWGYAAKLTATISRLEDRFIETSYINSKKKIDGIFAKKMYANARCKIESIDQELLKLDTLIRERSFIPKEEDLFSLRVTLVDFSKINHEPYKAISSKMSELFLALEQSYTNFSTKKNLLQTIRKMRFVCFLEEKIDREIKKAMLPELAEEIRKKHLEIAIASLRDQKKYFSIENISDYSATFEDVVKIMHNLEADFIASNYDKKTLKSFNLSKIIRDLPKKSYPLFDSLED